MMFKGHIKNKNKNKVPGGAIDWNSGFKNIFSSKIHNDVHCKNKLSVPHILNQEILCYCRHYGGDTDEHEFNENDICIIMYHYFFSYDEITDYFNEPLYYIGLNLLKYINELKLFDFTNDCHTYIIIRIMQDKAYKHVDVVYLLISMGINIRSICDPKLILKSFNKRHIRLFNILLNNIEFDILKEYLINSIYNYGSDDYLLNGTNTIKGIYYFDDTIYEIEKNLFVMLDKYMMMDYVKNIDYIMYLYMKVEKLQNYGAIIKNYPIKSFELLLNKKLTNLEDDRPIEVLLQYGLDPLNYSIGCEENLTILNEYKKKWIRKHFIGPLSTLILLGIITRITGIYIIASIYNNCMNIQESALLLDDVLFKN